MDTLATTPPAPMKTLALLSLTSLAAAASAAPIDYTLDPTHTFPSFEADHMGGVSVWRGKFNKSSGKAQLDRAGGAGTLEVTIQTDSIDFGLDLMNEHAKKADFFDVAKYPTSVYKGSFVFEGGVPVSVTGNLTLHGVTKPVDLKINSFKCIPHPMLKRELCGADAITTIRRDEFGISAGKDYGFSMDVVLRIQVEAIANQ